MKREVNRSSVGVPVERTKRLVLLANMPYATAESARAAFTAKLNGIAYTLRQTLIYDQGKRMARHRELDRDTNLNVYFCDPHSRWKRGGRENINGLLHQMLPKCAALSINE
ncbi:IS30 family transposase [Leptothrix discophora]|uniref:IS30 family transposase n=1 Tax=Leptothrix discophora TaxID=89 RepID=A0ABT9G925_LEPDI|nr:IS30 family transposase [Leptothrix discophora]MDP4302688.1 IS30 family transposase [Leptothrix discophora]